jgi:hypothetical protein
VPIKSKGNIIFKKRSEAIYRQTLGEIFMIVYKRVKMSNVELVVSSKVRCVSRILSSLREEWRDRDLWD